MKKLLLLVAVAFFGALSASAQCTPDPQYTNAGIFPDSATNFLPACVNQPYSQPVTNVVPQDTIVMVGPFPTPPIPIDSIVLDQVSGLPPGMTIVCNPNNCTYLGGTVGCALISGTCTVPGTYNLVFNLSAYVGGQPAPRPFTLDYYKIVVSSCNVGLDEKSTSVFSIFPNPAANKVKIEGLDKETIKNITLTNAEGKIINTYNIFEGSSLEMNMEGLNNGLYFVTINYGKGTEVLKLIKE